ncbi:MAG: hypothetical protein ACJAWM_001153 [Sulfitobacter sp.]|jgi:hypothetical protein
MDRAAGQGVLTLPTSEPQTPHHATTAECEAALEHILAAPDSGAVIGQLCFRPDFEQRSFPDTLEMTVKHGITGERWTKKPWLTLPNGDPDPRIQVSILSQRVMDLCWRDRENTVHPGDPIVVDMDLSAANLPVGTRLSAGSAILEVSDKFNTGCIKWHDRYGNDSLRWINKADHREYRLRGILCKIVQDGTVKVGDQLIKL